ncbi:MAG TPA: site-specific integrase [Longimicrobium sp.]|jgi:integrase|uniref:tyrosine-type recombinase/integrase n=1 Tax=Longimicrobium sp. TaxID=2029185 RepID=UPI002EDB5694
MAQKKKKSDTTPFAERLLTRLKTRPSAHGAVFVLDLRGRDWSGARPARSGFLTLRNPSDEGWPAKGATTLDQAVAEQWLRDHYAAWIERKLQINEDGPDSGLTVAEACDTYLEDLTKLLGADHNTVSVRRSVVRVHLKPAFGDVPLAALTRKRLRQFLEGLQVKKWEHGILQEMPAMRRTKENVRSTLQALWNHTYPDTAWPFGTLSMAERGVSRRRREAAEAGEIAGMTTSKSYTLAEITSLLARAVQYDRTAFRLLPWLPNTAETIALLVCTAARIDELMLLRWKHVLFEEEAIFIPGTKSAGAPRWIPMQRSLRPWLDRLRALHGGYPEPNAYVLHVRRGQPLKRPSRKTYGARLGKVEAQAALKRHRKATHGFRATHLSWAAPHLPDGVLKAYAGHSRARGGATDAYVETRPPFMPASHREVIQIPCPDVVGAARLGTAA